MTAPRITAALAALALVLAACGGGGGGDGARSTPVPNGADFATTRDELATRLASIGATIGTVPPDVRADLLADCRSLGQWVDGDEIDPICAAIDNAIERNDPGTIDLVVRQLQELED